MKKQNRFEILLIVAIMAGAGYAAFSDAHNFPNRWFTRDDAYYYFKVAQNISEGLGSTFDGVNLANGYHPLWMLINIPVFSLARFDLILPLRILLLLMGALHAATAVLLYRLISRVLSETTGMLIAIFWAFNLYIHATVTQFGLETGITAFSILLFLTLFEKLERKWRKEPLTQKEIIQFALVGVMVIFSRLDTVFLVLLFGFYLVFRKIPLRHLLLTDILGTFLVFFASVILRVGMKGYYLHGESTLKMALISLVLTIPLYYFAGLYQHPRNESLFSLLKRIFLSVTLSALLLSALLWGLQRIGFVDTFPRSIFFFYGGWILVTRLGFRFLSEKRERESLSALLQFQQNWKTCFTEGAIYFGIVGGALGAYMLFNKIVFGTATPISGQVKRWWGSLDGNVYGGAARRIYTFFGLDTTIDSDFNAWGLLTKFTLWLRDILPRWSATLNQDVVYWQLFFLILFLISVILLISSKRAVWTSVEFGLLPLFVGSVTQIISYNATGYAAAKEWYWVAEIIFTLLLFALLFDLFLRSLAEILPSARSIALAGIAILGFFWAQTFFAHIANLMPYGVEHEGHPYMDILGVVEENTEPGALIGMTGSGNTGYYISGRTIINMDGLINSYEYFQAHKAGRGDEFLAEMGMDYIFVNPVLLEDLPYKGEFEGRLGEVVANYGKKELVEFIK